MGWCSATRIFDSVAAALLDEESKTDVHSVLKELAIALEDSDWDCQCDSDYYDHPVVEGVFKDLHPYWFEED